MTKVRVAGGRRSIPLPSCSCHCQSCPDEEKVAIYCGAPIAYLVISAMILGMTLAAAKLCEP
eukprot:COSAG05_NODE_2957_length_2466_cov_2.106886_3_plen_62_part_00